MTWFANAIHYDRSNVYKMLKHETIDLVLLMRISELLNYDFLHDCSKALDFKPTNRTKSTIVQQTPEEALTRVFPN